MYTCRLLVFFMVILKTLRLQFDKINSLALSHLNKIKWNKSSQTTIATRKTTISTHSDNSYIYKFLTSKSSGKQL